MDLIKKSSLWLLVLSFLLLTFAMALIFFYAPEEATQGVTQKIFYLHLGCVTAMYIPLFLGLIFSVIYLASKKLWSDALAISCIEVGYLFTTCVLITGSIWAKPIWGAWWTWDVRLTTTLLIWLVYTTYHLVRFYFGATTQGRNVTAILAIIGFLDVPLIHYSVQWFRGVHPQVITEGGITASMAVTLTVTMLAVLTFSFLLIQLRFRLENLLRRVA